MLRFLNCLQQVRYRVDCAPAGNGLALNGLSFVLPPCTNEGDFPVLDVGAHDVVERGAVFALRSLRARFQGDSAARQSKATPCLGSGCLRHRPTPFRAVLVSIVRRTVAAKHLE